MVDCIYCQQASAKPGFVFKMQISQIVDIFQRETKEVARFCHEGPGSFGKRGGWAADLSLRGLRGEDQLVLRMANEV